MPQIPRWISRVPPHESYACWRTWFLEECEQTGLFGIPERDPQLRWLRNCVVGTRFYLEDAPYHFRGDSGRHRLCGPFEVLESTLPSECEAEVTAMGRLVALKQRHPDRGPWKNAQHRQRFIENRNVTFCQDAEKFGWFPIRLKHFATQDPTNPYQPPCRLPRLLSISMIRAQDRPSCIW